MVQDHIREIVGAKGVGAARFFVLIAQADPDIAYNDIAAVSDADSMIAQRDSVAGGGLAGNSQVRFVDLKLGFKLDCTGDIEDDCAWAAGRDDSVTERAGPFVFEVSNMVNVAAAAPLRASRRWLAVLRRRSYRAASASSSVSILLASSRIMMISS